MENLSILRFVKLLALGATDALGINKALMDSAWRSRQLLIICWHKLSLEDEHLWNPHLCLSQETFLARLRFLQLMKCNVLTLDDALDRLQKNTLPPRSVVLTIDDGDSSVYLSTWPALRSFGFPATLYWTTYYSTHSYAVFDPMLQYLIWKGRQSVLKLDEPSLRNDLRHPRERHRAFNTIYNFAKLHAWSAARKELFLENLSLVLGIDYQQIKSKRILHLIHPSEARSMASQGLDIQLHTHRHRVPLEESPFAAEIADNANVIRSTLAVNAKHFCYPSGSFVPQFSRWLAASGVVSATTCQPGLVSKASNPYFLPRFVDQNHVRQPEFAAWVSGLAGCIGGQQQIDTRGFK